MIQWAKPIIHVFFLLCLLGRKDTASTAKTARLVPNGEAFSTDISIWWLMTGRCQRVFVSRTCMLALFIPKLIRTLHKVLFAAHQFGWDMRKNILVRCFSAKSPHVGRVTDPNDDDERPCGSAFSCPVRFEWSRRTARHELALRPHLHSDGLDHEMWNEKITVRAISAKKRCRRDDLLYSSFGRKRWLMFNDEWNQSDIYIVYAIAARLSKSTINHMKSCERSVDRIGTLSSWMVSFRW